MKKFETTPEIFAPAFGGGSIARLFGAYGPRPLLDKEDGSGTGNEDDNSGDDEAAKAAAAAEAAKAAEKAAADKAAKEKADAEAAAKKAKDDADAARKKAEEDAEKEKGSKLTDRERELLHEVMDRKDRERNLKKERDDAIARIAAIEEKERKAKEKADAEKAKADKEAAEKAGDFERVKKMMADEHKKQIEAEREKAREARQALKDAQKTIDDLTVGAQFNTSKFVMEQLTLPPTMARKIYGDHFELENGKVVAFDKPKGAGERTKFVDASGEPVPFEDALKKLIESSAEKDRLIKSNLKEGANSQGDRRGTLKTGEKVAEVSGKDRIAAALAAGKLGTKKAS